MNIEVSFSDASGSDFDRLYDFGHQRWGERRTNDFIQALRQACLNLSNAPLKGKLRNEIGAEVRSIVYREHVIFHRLQNARRLVILRIFHGREDISTLSL